MPGARRNDACGADEACGPKLMSGAPVRVFRTLSARVSASHVGKLLGKRISVGIHASRASVSANAAAVLCDAVRSMRRTSWPRCRNSAAIHASVSGGFVVPSTSSRS